MVALCTTPLLFVLEHGRGILTTKHLGMYPHTYRHSSQRRLGGRDVIQTFHLERLSY
jgi:hypothetical protein